MKILLIRLSSIGDIILTEPVTRYFLEIYPGVKIDYITRKKFASLVEMFEGVSRVIPYTNRNDMLSLLKDERYDLLVDLHAKLRTKALKRGIKAKTKVTYDKKHLLRRLIIAKFSRRTIDSTLDLYLSIFPKLKIELPVERFQPRLKHIVEHSMIKITNKANIPDDQKKLIAIFPGAVHPTKCYPPESFAEFISLFAQDQRFRFVLMGSANDNVLAQRIVDLCQVKPLNWCGRFDFKQLVEFMLMFEIIITNDSGPMHIAAALQKKQIAIFGATHPKLGFRPLNDQAKILQVDLSCRPCSLHGGKRCPRGHFKCMKNITPVMLREALLSF